MGVLIGSAVIPIALCLMWKKTNKWGAIAGALLGQWFGLVAWVVFAKVWAAVSKGLALDPGFTMLLCFLLFGVVSLTHWNLNARHCLRGAVDMLRLESRLEAEVRSG